MRRSNPQPTRQARSNLQPPANSRCFLGSLILLALSFAGAASSLSASHSARVLALFYGLSSTLGLAFIMAVSALVRPHVPPHSLRIPHHRHTPFQAMITGVAASTSPFDERVVAA